MDALEFHLQDQLAHSQRLFWHRLRWKAIRSYLPAGRSFELIDIGAGAGFLGAFLRRDRPMALYKFVEPLSSLRDHLATEYGEAADALTQSDYAEADFVALLDVLEHQEDDHGFLEELSWKMAPGSQLILTVPAQERLWSAWDESLGHFRRYNKSLLAECMKGLPLRIVEMNYMFPELVPLGYYRAHRNPPGSGSGLAGKAEFPKLPSVINDLLYGLGVASLALRTHWHTGSSLFVVATRLVEAPRES
jgi:hypothetical protein